MNPIIFIGVVTYDGKDYCLEKFSNALKSINYDPKEIVITDNSLDDNHIKKIQDLGLNAIKTNHFNNPKDSMVDSRNILRKIFLEGDYDYFFSVDSDIMLPEDCINKLLEPGKKIISGVYFNKFRINKKDMIFPILYKNMNEKELQTFRAGLSKHALPENQRKMFDEEFKKEYPILRKQLLPEDVEEDKIIRINLCGHGCLMISREVIEKIKFRYNKAFDDSVFCIDAEKLGYEIYARTGVKCVHLPSNNWESILKR